MLDIEMPGGDGLSAAKAPHIALSSCRFMVLTTFGCSVYLRRAMVSGAVVKDVPASQLAIAIQSVIAGEWVIDPELALAALAEGYNPLTTRERCETSYIHLVNAPRSEQSWPANVEYCPQSCAQAHASSGKAASHLLSSPNIL
jgi:hypothetical protein